MSKTFLAEDGTLRQAHYGGNRQPWDEIVDAGWAPEFAAGNVLKYLRRTKEPEHSLESARWYHARLLERAAAQYENSAQCRIVLRQLFSMLTEKERQLLQVGV